MRCSRRHPKVQGERCPMCKADAMARGLVAAPHEKGMDWTKRYEGPREPQTVWTRVCVTCEEERPIEHYYPQRGCKDGRRNECKGCQVRKSREREAAKRAAK